MNKHCILLLLVTMCCQPVVAGSLPDPTRPASVHVAAPEPVNTIRVEAIVISDTVQWAIVNGVVIHRGDHIANAVIEEISSYSVRYSRNGHSDIALLPHSTLQVRRDDTPHEDSP